MTEDTRLSEIEAMTCPCCDQPKAFSAIGTNATCIRCSCTMHCENVAQLYEMMKRVTGIKSGGEELVHRATYMPFMNMGDLVEKQRERLKRVTPAEWPSTDGLS